MSSSNNNYYLPHGTKWPFLSSVSLLILFLGLSSFLNGSPSGMTIMFTGLALLLIMVYGWFSTVIQESESGVYNLQVDVSFRWGMVWFIFSEVMFFSAFFGSLYYARELSLPWLGGDGYKTATNLVLWPQFENVWPSNGPLNVGGDFTFMKASGIPALNTLILLTSGLTVTYAHHGLKEQNRKKLINGLILTILLGFTFVAFQAYEYIHAYSELNLKLTTGIYGSTFFMLTGFHGFHVTLGAIMLTVILLRCIKGHFSGDNHFGFEAVAWYWHFVDVVWLGLFVFVYWL
ncbi:MAG: cytochrome c oxidase subunit 3 [Gammaproteobacteria bacterium]|nr:cytochrome c oxidase subunit 3 [Gammaproteobacteria bacterium]|tara:strand:+ start:4332 stop:5198 length:867 start_codon:yes stop_codon:yes gene_type:complete